MNKFRKWFKERTLEEIRLDYMNNFLTIEGMADYYGLEPEKVKWAIETAQVENRKLQEWKQKAENFNQTGQYYV